MFSQMQHGISPLTRNKKYLRKLTGKVFAKLELDHGQVTCLVGSQGFDRLTLLTKGGLVGGLGLRRARESFLNPPI